MFRRQSSLWLATALLLLMFGLAVGSLVQKAPTFDEQGFIVRGLAYLRGEHRGLRVGHPLGLNALNALLLRHDDSVRLPIDHPSWQDNNFHRPAELFLWEIGNDVAHIMFLARLPTVWLGLLAAAVAGRWAFELSGRRSGGLLALALLALDPNLMAHSRLATTDLGLTAGAVLAGFTLWRWLARPSWPRAIVAGVAFGLLQNTKFTAGLFVPLFALVILVAAIRFWRASGAETEPVSFRSLLAQLLLAYPLAGFLTLWAAYGFQIGTLPADLPTMATLSGRTLPLAHHLEQLLDIGGRLQKSTPSFLLGQYSDTGWWYYFPVAFLLKTPLPTLLLLGWAAVVGLQVHFSQRPMTAWRDGRHLTGVLVPPVGYFAIALTTDINLGYRHILPVLPFLAVFIGMMLAPIRRPQFVPAPIRRAALLLLPLWLLVASLAIYPHYLAYFNPLAGGPDNGWRALVDSNLDWGQDLALLAERLREQESDPVWLSYFGEARPEYYGIAYKGLPSFPPRLMNPDARPFYPADPAPGVYAISASNLQGVLFQDHNLMGWFRAREPVGKVGYSIFLYEVPAHGVPVALLLSGLQMDEIKADDFARLGTNDVTPRWFDAGQSFLVPNETEAWVALGETGPPHPRVEAAWQNRILNEVQTSPYRLFQLDLAGLVAEQLSELDQAVDLRQGEGEIQFLAAELPETAAAGGTLELATWWQQHGRPHPVKMFIHLLDERDQLVAQWDGLGVAWEGWRQGDRLLQLHSLTVPPEANGRYTLWAGLYQPSEPFPRWVSDHGDRLYLGEIRVP